MRPSRPSHHPRIPPPITDQSDHIALHLPRAVGGDHQSTMVVFGVVAPAVASVVRALLGPGHPELDDVTQESLLAVHDALRRFRGESSFVHYARRIAVRTALAARRRVRPTAATEAAFEETVEPGGTDRLASGRRMAAFRNLLDALPASQAEALAMRVVLDHSLPEVAEATGAPLNTVRSRIRLAKEQLRRWIVADPLLAALFEVDR